MSGRRVTRSGRYVRVAIHCRGTAGRRCQGKLLLGTQGRYGRGKFNVATGRNAVVKVKLTARMLRLLERRRRVLVSGAATYVKSDGVSATKSRKLRVIEPRRKAR